MWTDEQRRAHLRKAVRAGHISVVTSGKSSWKHLEGELNQKDYRRQDHSRGERNVNAKLTDAAVVEIRRRLASETYTSIARDFGVHRNQISRIASGRTWKHVGVEPCHC